MPIFVVKDMSTKLILRVLAKWGLSGQDPFSRHF